MSKLYQKAVIEIQTYEVTEVQEQEIRPSVAASGGLTPFGGITNKLKEAAAQTVHTALSSTLGSMVSAVAENLSNNNKKIEVQFNPSEIHITASGKLPKEKTGVDKKRKNIDYGSGGTTVQVSIPLIFEEMSGGETLTSSLWTGSKENSVSQKVSMFLDAIRDPYSRKIIFSWGNQVYKGRLQSVNTEYTMFSSQGSPVRAKVTIELAWELGRDDVKNFTGS